MTTLKNSLNPPQLNFFEDFMQNHTLHRQKVQVKKQQSGLIYQFRAVLHEVGGGGGLNELR